MSSTTTSYSTYSPSTSGIINSVFTPGSWQHLDHSGVLAIGGSILARKLLFDSEPEDTERVKETTRDLYEDRLIALRRATRNKHIAQVPTFSKLTKEEAVSNWVEYLDANATEMLSMPHTAGPFMAKQYLDLMKKTPSSFACELRFELGKLWDALHAGCPVVKSSPKKRQLADEEIQLNDDENQERTSVKENPIDMSR